MKFVSFQHEGAVRGGVLEGDRIRPLAHGVLAHIAGGKAAPEFHGESIPLASVKLVAPLPNPPRIFCIDLNYRAHAAESQKNCGEESRPSS